MEVAPPLPHLAMGQINDLYGPLLEEGRNFFQWSLSIKWQFGQLGFNR